MPVPAPAPADAVFATAPSWLALLFPCLSRRRRRTTHLTSPHETHTPPALLPDDLDHDHLSWQLQPHEHTPLLPSRRSSPPPPPPAPTPARFRGMTAPSVFAPPPNMPAALLGHTMSKLSGAYIPLPRERPSPSSRSPRVGTRSRSSTTNLWLTPYPGTPVEPRTDSPAMRRMGSSKGLARDAVTGTATPPSSMASSGVNQQLSSYSFGKPAAAAGASGTQNGSVPSSSGVSLLAAPPTRRGGHRRGNPSWPSPLDPIQDVPSATDALAAVPGVPAVQQHSPSDSITAPINTAMSGSRSTSTSSITAVDAPNLRRRSGPSSSTSTSAAKVDASRALVPVTPMPWVRFRTGTAESAMTRASLGSLPGLSACSSASLSDHAGPPIAAPHGASGSARNSLHSLHAAGVPDSETSTPQSAYQPRLIPLDFRHPVAESPPAKSRELTASDDDEHDSAKKTRPSVRTSSGTPTPLLARSDEGGTSTVSPSRSRRLASRKTQPKICSTSEVSSGATPTALSTPSAARAARAMVAMIPRLGWSTSPTTTVGQARRSPGSGRSTPSPHTGASTTPHARIPSAGVPRTSPSPRTGPSSPYCSKARSPDTELLPWHPSFGASSDAALIATGSVGSDV